MADYVTLVGAEEVSRAASRMQSAADDMQRAANTISESLERHARQMDEWIGRLENVAQQLAAIDAEAK